MISHEVISPSTNAALLEAAGRYFETVVPYIQPGVDGFMEAFFGRLPEDNAVLISGDPDTITVNMYGDKGETRRLLTIDLQSTETDVAAIVSPGMYAASGERDSLNGAMKWAVVRQLYEKEGRELTMDLYAIMFRAPASQRKTEARQH